MAFTPRTQVQIRAAILAGWASRYRDLGLELATAKDTEPYQLADAVAFPLEGLELRALQLTREIFPDTASTAMLERHAELIGLARKAATKARINVTVTGVNGSTYTTSGVLTSADGLQFKPVSSGVVDPGTSVSVLVECQTAGIAGNKAVGTVLTWQSAPTGINSTAAVNSSTTGAVIAADAEKDPALVARVLAWWRERPGSGNRADIQQWALSRAGIENAFVYPLAHPTLGLEIPGTFSVLVTGSADGRTPSTPFGLTGAQVTDVHDYIAGEGTYAPDAQISAAMDPDDVTVSLPTAAPTNVELVIVPAAGQEFSFVGTFTAAGGSTTTRLNLTTNPTGTIVSGDWVAARTGVRGEYEARQVAGGVGSSYVDVSPPFTNAPSSGWTVLPGAPWWEDLRDALIALFDRMGPGDVNTGSFPQSARFPSADVAAPFILYRSALVAVAMGIPGFSSLIGVSGVLSAAVSLPVGDVTPAAFEQLTPGSILFTA